MIKRGKYLSFLLFKTIFYKPDRVVGDRDQTLADFIRTTEPTCGGPVRMVSFRSCLDG
jgi:hypothetical protein